MHTSEIKLSSLLNELNKSPCELRLLKVVAVASGAAGGAA